MDYKKAFAQIIFELLPDIPLNDIEDSIETPPDASLGHFAFPCFRCAKEAKKAPNFIAKDLSEKINATAKPEWLSHSAQVNAYLNIFIDRAKFARETLNEIISSGGAYGSSDEGGGRTVLVEFSSPNIAKHFHVGHLGSTLIGHSLSKILKHLGYNVVRLNYLGDWGTQFGKLITAYLKWGNKEKIESEGLDELVRLYVRFHKEADADDSLNDEARAWVVKMQDGDEEGLSLWKWFYELSMKEFNRIYERLNVSYDAVLRESQYNQKMREVADELAAKGLLRESDGAMIVDLEPYGMPPCLILKRDGGTLYPTRDIASALDRYDRYAFSKSLYVTANEQILHFAQWMKVVEITGREWAKDMTHIPYGLYIFESGKMSTRRGEVIKVDELLEEAVRKTLDIIREKNPDLPDKEKVAEQVGIGAVIFNKLYNGRIKDVLFSWERMLNFEGETGPYVQYTRARACSMLEKAGAQTFENINGALLCDDEAFDVVRLLYDYPQRIVEAAEKYEPFVISRHMVAIAQAFNKFYHAHTVLVDEPELRGARLALANAVAVTLKNGVALLGIESPDRM